MKLQSSVDEFLHYIEIEKNCSPHTYRGYAYDLLVFHQFLGRLYHSDELAVVCASLVRRFIQEQVINQNNKPRTLQRRISCLKSFSKFCQKEKWIETDFMGGIATPKADKRLPVYMRMPELKQLFQSLEFSSKPYALRNELMFKLLATTGMRRQEIVDLTWNQLDLEQKTIRIYGKGRKERLIPLHQIVLPLLERYKKQQLPHQLHPDVTVFVTRSDRPIDPRVLHRMFKYALIRAGLPPQRFSLHHLRHTFATLLLQNKDHSIELRTLQELLGHDSLSTTGMYTHVDLEAMRRAMQWFDLS